MEIGLLIWLCVACTYSMVAKRLSASVVTAPMIFLGLGFGLYYFDFVHVQASKEVLYNIAEIAIVVVLFLDASQINIKHLQHQNAWPLRMLLLGLPLSIALGTLVPRILSKLALGFSGINRGGISAN